MNMLLFFFFLPPNYSIFNFYAHMFALLLSMSYYLNITSKQNMKREKSKNTAIKWGHSAFELPGCLGAVELMVEVTQSSQPQ